MKVALLICTYNRPQYLRQTLWSLERADLSKIDKIIIVDDCSTDKETHKLISNFIIFAVKTVSFINDVNSGIKYSLTVGYEYAFSHGFDIVINLDSDAIVRPDFVDRLLGAHEKGMLLTGFHSVTKNANGTDRHKILNEYNFAYRKQSVGGINFCIDKEAYESYLKPALNMLGNFDHNACILAGGAYCLKQSVIQHIGFDSSMGHTEAPDVADDFYYWDLPDVTLIGVDSQHERLKTAMDICTKWIRFGDVKQITHSISSKEQYSEFCVKELYKHVTTSHMLICQHDGYVHNWQSWDNDWLQYDYIGAPWHYNDGMAVGNGGFSLRSRRLMEIVATDPHIQFHHPEDHHICRTYRPYLEAKYGIKFAPVEVAERFSFEGYMQPDKNLGEQFGKHGSRVIKPAATRRTYLPNQFRGLGDILFLIPMIRELINEGNTVIWPIVSEYMNIAKHFPDIDFRDMDTLNLPYDSRNMTHTNYGQLVPYRFASENMHRDLTRCMQSKYELYGHNYLTWRNLYWHRDRVSESTLLMYLNLKPSDKFTLVNRNFAAKEHGYKVTTAINSSYPIVEMREIDRFSLIDWLYICELAQEIHTANTAIMYLLELMTLNKPVYVYKRRTWGERDFEHTRELWTNKDFIFEV